VIAEAAPAAPEGLLLIDKPPGITSHDAVARVRRALGTKKVGHAGTLDPMATGLLVIGVGRATRLLRFLGDLPKTYEGSFRLGTRTTTLDADGERVSQAPA
jgi:tRNA pseudouridine55 synthase